MNKYSAVGTNAEPQAKADTTLWMSVGLMMRDNRFELTKSDVAKLVQEFLYAQGQPTSDNAAR